MLEGRLLGGRYRVLRQLGRGGMGVVYAALQEDLQRRVAVKVLVGHERLSDDALARFRREALSAAELGNPNIVQVTDFQTNDGEPPFLVMELLEGESLQALLEREQKLPQERAAFIATQMLAALSAAHAARLIHRDVKPGNVFLTRTPALGDLVKVLDFGIVKVLRETEDGPRSMFGTVRGTPAYMAPEQAKGLDIDARVDIYATGSCLFEMIAGRKPFFGATRTELLEAITTRPAPPLQSLAPWVDPRLAAVVDASLAKSPDARPQSALEMLRLLAPFVRAPSSGDVASLLASTGITTPEAAPHAPTTELMTSPPTPMTSDGPVRPRAKTRPVPMIALLLITCAFAIAAPRLGSLLAKRPSAIPSGTSPSATPIVFAPAPAAPGTMRVWITYTNPVPGALVGDPAEDFAGFIGTIDGGKLTYSPGVIDGTSFTNAWVAPFINGDAFPFAMTVAAGRVVVKSDEHRVTILEGATGRSERALDTDYRIQQLCVSDASAEDVWVEMLGNHEATINVVTGAIAAATKPPNGCRYRDVFGKGKHGGRGLQHAAEKVHDIDGRWLNLLEEDGLGVADENIANGDELTEGFDLRSSKRLWSRLEPRTRVTPHVLDVIGGRAFLQDKGWLESVDARTGHPLWHITFDELQLPTDHLTASPARVYYSGGANAVTIYDAVTGARLGHVSKL